jgi:hypothetical protein
MRMGDGAVCCLMLAVLTAMVAASVMVLLSLDGVIDGEAMTADILGLVGFVVLVMEIPREDKA